MNTPIAARRLTWYVVAAVTLAAGCASTDKPLPEPEKVSGVSYLTQGATFRFWYLHQLNIDEGPRLREDLQRTLSYDVLALSEMLRHYNLSTDERARVQRTLTLIAVQNEKFPVAEWKSDDRVMAALNAAVAENPKYADEVRARNWSKPIWER
jgi:hypothetical protein